MIRGDIFHDGLLCYWIIHEKPKGKKLFVAPLENMFDKPTKGGCSFFHDLAGWDFSKVKVVCNLYKNPIKAKKLIGKGNYLEDTLINAFNPVSNTSLPAKQ
jgi:hypothetical protein